MRAALRYFTIFPVGGGGEDDPKEAARYLPLVGLVLGALLYLLALLFFRLWPGGVAAGLLLFFWLVFTGFLHLDGLLDLADALFYPGSQKRRLEILADARVGSFAFGVGASHLLLKWAALASVGGGAWLVVAPLWARTLPLFAAFFLPQGGETGGRFAKGARLWPGALGLLGALLFPLPAFFALLLAAIIYLAAWRGLGRVSGDVHGAAIELAELGFLLGLSLN